jgi:hypothetical protein
VLLAEEVMSKPFDATMKDLGADYPYDYLTTFDLTTTEPTRLLNVDLSTVTTAADVVLGLGRPLREIVHLDFQASADKDKDADVLVYNGLLFRQYRVPVHSILVLLRSQAEHSEVTGSIAYAARPGRGNMNFGFEIVRLWERSAEALLSGPLGTAPLAMLGALPEGADLVQGLTGIAHQLIERLEREAAIEQKKLLLTAAFVLTGLRIQRNQAKQVFAGVRNMRESDTFLAILDEGREIQTRHLIRRIAKRKLGEPDEQTVTCLEGITDLERLERIHDRAGEASSWQDLLDTP